MPSSQLHYLDFFLSRLPKDGLPTGGLLTDGPPIDGLPIDGLPTDGPPTDGLPLSEHFLPLFGDLDISSTYDTRIFSVLTHFQESVMINTTTG